MGDELLSGHTPNSNSTWLAARLRGRSSPCSRIVVIPDQVEAIAAELAAAIRGPAQLVFCCGGLGPTPDDRTMAAVAAALGVPLVESEEVVARIRERVARRFREGSAASPEPNPGTMKMALIPAGAGLLRNPVGGAPPLAIALPSSRGERWLFVLPGVPAELEAIVDHEILPRFLGGGERRHYRELHFRGVPESVLFPLLTEMEQSFPQLSFGSYPQPDAALVLRISGSDQELLEEAAAALRGKAPVAPSD